MTYREQFNRIMAYDSCDALPVVFWGGWPETHARWHAEGMPAGMTGAETLAFFGADAHCLWGHTCAGIFGGPFAEGLIDFGTETLEETDAYRIYRDRFGVITKELRGQSNIPLHLEYTFKTAADWPQYKRMLTRDPARIPSTLDADIARAEASGHPIVIYAGSLMGWVRNWMGVEQFSFLMYDDPDCLGDIVDTIADLACWNIDLIAPRLTHGCDLGFCWEDICGRSGPLVSPHIFRQYIAPGYRKIRAKLEAYGVSLFAVDSDGDISQLIEPWLEAGVNVQFPVEVGVMRQDARVYRQRYGKELRLLGNVDKLALERGPAAVDAELERLHPLIRDGGFIPHLDHSPTPHVSVEMYRDYFRRVRALRI